MGRRALDLGEHGEIEAYPQARDEAGRWKRAEGARDAQRWRARAYVRGFDGVRREVSGFGKTKRLAIASVQRSLNERQAAGGDVVMQPSTPLLRAGDLWLDQIRRSDSGLAANTVRIYADTWRRYVAAEGSTLRGLTLAQANDPQRLRGFLQRVADTAGTSTAKTAKSALAGVLHLAVDNGVLPANALRQVRPVRSQKSADGDEGARDHTRAFTRAERDAVVAYADELAGKGGDPRTVRKWQTVADLVAFLAGTGVRIDEARSIRWADVNLDDGTVYVRGTKTETSDRVLNLPQWLRERLSLRSSRTGTAGLLFASPGHVSEPGRKWDEYNSHRAVRAVLDGAGFEWAISHTFRRTVATMLHEQGAPLVKIADQLGHADPGMTARVYLGRDLKGDKSALADLL